MVRPDKDNSEKNLRKSVIMVLENGLFFKFFAWGVGVNEYPRDISSELEIHIGMDGSVRVNY